MTTLQRAKCLIGLHRWGEWEYQSTVTDEAPESCRSRRRCAECDAAETRDEEGHLWSEWRYISETDCVRKRNCSRCRAEEKGGLEHRWSEWELSDRDGCQEKRSCSVCGASETRKAHAWGAWTTEEERSCTRCHAKQRKHGSFELCKEAGRCDVCSRDFGPGEGYSVPVTAFYDCEKYREWLAKCPETFAINIAGGIDQFLIEEMCSEGRKCCAVCKVCISMFSSGPVK